LLAKYSGKDSQRRW